MLGQLGRNTFPQNIIDEWVGNGAQTLVKRALSGSKVVDDSSFSEEYFQNALKIFLQNYKENVCVHTKLYPKVYETLKKLYESNFILVIITNKPYEFIQPILQKLQIEEFFSFYLGGDSLKAKKPDPEPLLHVCEKFHKPKETTVIIGDSKNDIVAAKNAGIQSIAVNYGYNYGENISQYAPDFTVENFGEILNILSSWKKQREK